MDAPINVDDLEVSDIASTSSDDAEWEGGYFAYGGNGANATCVIYFAVPPGKRLGRHTDTAEETQLFLGGSGELLLDDGAKPVKSGDVIVLTEGTMHDLHKTPPPHQGATQRPSPVMSKVSIRVSLAKIA